MDYSSYRKAFDAYSQLSDLQKQRFFPGREYVSEMLCGKYAIIQSIITPLY